MNAVPDFTPADLWHIICGRQVSVVKLTPTLVMHSMLAGRLNRATLDTMLSAVEASKAINKMMGRDENFGV